MKQKPILLIVLAVLTLGGALALWNGHQRVEPEEPLPGAGHGPTVTGQKVSFIVTEEEVKKWRLEAASAIYNETHTEATLKDIHGMFFDKTGKVVLTFSAPAGFFSNQDKLVKLHGGVEVKATGDPGGVMHAPEMTWSEKQKDVLATGGVEMIYPDLGVSRAERARFSLDFSFISLEGGVLSEITPKD